MLLIQPGGASLMFTPGILERRIFMDQRLKDIKNDIKITTKMILSWIPGTGYTEEHVVKFGCEGCTPQEICNLPILPKDKLFILLRKEILPKKTLLELEIKFANDGFCMKSDQDPIVFKGVKIKELWLDGKASDNLLKEAYSRIKIIDEINGVYYVNGEEPAFREAHKSAIISYWDAALTKTLGIIEPALSAMTETYEKYVSWVKKAIESTVINNSREQPESN